MVEVGGHIPPCLPMPALLPFLWPRRAFPRQPSRPTLSAALGGPTPPPAPPVFVSWRKTPIRLHKEMTPPRRRLAVTTSREGLLLWIMGAIFLSKFCSWSTYKLIRQFQALGDGPHAD